MKRRASIVVVFASLLTAGCGGSDGENDSATELALMVSGSSRAMYPSFSPEIRQYAVGCEATDNLSLTVRTPQRTTRTTVNVANPLTGDGEVALPGLTGQDDIVVDVLDLGVSTRYVIHCLPEDFPQIEVLHAEEAVSDGLILTAPKFREAGERRAYLAVIDNNGVPRFHQKVNNAANDFKRQADGRYSYLLGLGPNNFGLFDSVVVLLDESFGELTRLTTVGLTQTDSHDFLITEEGNYLFISYNSTLRDLSPFGYAVDEMTGDSVIQEVTPAGNMVFQWNSWDHIDLADCQATGYPAFPIDYAHLNSIQLTPAGDIIASFRGCAQILKIDRPTGDVIWQLGGSASDFTIVGDPFEEFCGQHTARELEGDRLIMFDNGAFCLGDRETIYGQFSRVLEYRLDATAGQAMFTRDHALSGSYQEFTGSQGSVQELDNGNWLIGWGNGPDVSITEVDTAGNEVFAMRITKDADIAVTYRAFRYPDLMLPASLNP